MSTSSSEAVPVLDSSETLGPVQGPEPAPTPADKDTVAEASSPAAKPVETIVPTEKPPSKETRQTETQALFETAMMVKATEAEKKLAKKEPLTPEEEAFIRYKRTYEHTKTTTPHDFVANDPDKRGSDFDAQPIFVRMNTETNKYTAADGSGQRIKEITSRFQNEDDGQVYFRCNLEGATEPVNIKANIILDSLALSGREMYVKALGEKSPHVKTVIEAHINHIQNPKAEPPQNQTIKEAARQIGLVTAETAKKLIDASDLTDEGKAKLKSFLEGKNIATPEDVGQILWQTNNLDGRIENTQKKIESYETTIKGIEGILKNLPPDSPARNGFDVQIAQAKAEIDKLEPLLKQMKFVKESIKNIDTPEALTELVKGSYNSGKALELEKAIQSENFDAIFETLVGHLPDDDPVKMKFKELIKNAANLGSIGIMAIIAIMVMQAVSAK